MIDGEDCEAVDKMNEWQGKQKYSDKTLPYCRFVHDKSRVTSPELEPGNYCGYCLCPSVQSHEVFLCLSPHATNKDSVVLTLFSHSGLFTILNKHE
jgi:hypothetical protein